MFFLPELWYLIRERKQIYTKQFCSRSRFLVSQYVLSFWPPNFTLCTVVAWDCNSSLVSSNSAIILVCQRGLLKMQQLTTVTFCRQSDASSACKMSRVLLMFCLVVSLQHGLSAIEASRCEASSELFHACTTRYQIGDRMTAALTAPLKGLRRVQDSIPSWWWRFPGLDGQKVL